MYRYHGNTELLGGNDAAAATRKAETNDRINANAFEKAPGTLPMSSFKMNAFPNIEKNKRRCVNKRQEAFATSSPQRT